MALVKNINLLGPNPSQPFDVQTEQAKLAQAQQVAQALIAKGMTDEPPVNRGPAGNPYGYDTPNWGGPVLNALNTYLGNKQMEETQTKQAALAQIIAERNKADTEEYFKKSFGQAEPGVGPPTPAGEPPPDMPGRRDIVGAIRMGLSSQNPAINKIALEDYKNIPGADKMLVAAQHMDPATLAQWQAGGFGDPSVLRQAKKFENVGGVGVTTQGGEVTGEKPITQWEDMPQTSGRPLLQRNTKTGEIRQAESPYGSQSPAASMEISLGNKMVDILEKSRVQYMDNQGRMATIGQVKADIAAIPEGKFGLFPEFRQGINKFLAIGKLSLDPATTDMDSVLSETKKLILGDIRKLAPVTKEDIAVVQDILGAPRMTKDALLKAMAVLEAATQREMNQHMRIAKDFPYPKTMDRDAMYNYFVPEFNSAVVPPAGASREEDRKATRKRLGLSP